ncbi:unclassified [Brachyspira pilosicoli WesB]|uniref:Uncharacterized protein n=4 Tax=Brachyspira pilosicoli TaxID=52584 RepID=D8ICA6_BRAP9|nr:hypothetical protein BP951000_0781 [Brachyspira pilosicoli 95/1000]AFR71496.1 hypothetical protein B2904_orf2168 [Brachyspira pilosicoli B2904]AGA67402.1 hypothetical protein BPP43_11230 [Brachyspira pilosicoli P43/6/78]PLV57853.1 hypothetical protein BPSP16_09780 [Brachyspira pilosicoli SP16]CCG57563.1 unclassified [Brachyspira pilosicoli WesB]SUW04703.1 unclassified [Brachyspira pilosicoli]
MINKLLLIGFVLLCIYAITTRIVNNRKDKNDNNKD